MAEIKKGLFEGTIGKIKENRDKRLRGEIISIPWSLPRLSKVLPGIEPEKMIVVTAGTKVGKSQLANFLYLFQPIDYLFEHPECNLDIKIFYFSLEISKEAIMRQAMSYRLFKRYGLAISQQKLSSVFNDYILDDAIVKFIEAEEPWFKFLESKLDVTDELRNPTAIFKYMKDWLDNNGIWTYRKIRIGDEDRTIRDQYFPNNPNLIVQGIVDHLSILSCESGLGQRETIGRFSSDYCLELRDKYKCAMVLVQQQALEGSKQQFTNSGRSIIEKLMPDAANLANNKEVSRDVNLMVGLFDPFGLGFESYKDYDLSRLRRNFRELKILLNRDGESGGCLSMYFQGASCFFQELPKGEDMQESDYIDIEQRRTKVI